MKLSSFSYLMKEGFKNVFKNKTMSFASTATVCACILIMIFSFCFESNVEYMLEQIEESIGVAVFLENDVTADDIIRISDEINEIDNISSVTYISPDEALEGLMDDWGVEEGILEGFTGSNNPLSNSFEIEISNIYYQKDVVAKLNAIDGVKSVRHAQAETDVLINIEKVFRYVGWAIILALAVISVLIIMNTIRLSVETRKNEINIMKYVGATDWFIRWPFVIEGLIMGIIGSLIPIILSWVLYDKAIELIYKNFPMISSIATFRHSLDLFIVIFPIALAAGIALGIIGSVASVHKHLQV